MSAMLNYMGTELIIQIQSAYRSRFELAIERGFDDPANKYFWLYEELQYRLGFLRQITLFIDALPRFICKGAEDEAVGYVVRFVSRLYSNENCGCPELKDGQHPFFNDANRYFCDFTEALNHFGTDYDLSNHPILYIDLCECLVRAARLHLQIREQQYHAIDRDKFNVLMQMPKLLPESA